MPILEISGRTDENQNSRLKSVIIEEILKESLDFASIRAEWQILKFASIKPARIEEIRKESLYFATEEAKNDKIIFLPEHLKHALFD